MKLKETLIDYMKDEKKGAKDYMKLSMRLKKLNPKWSSTARKMAMDELHHRRKLMSIYKKLKKVI